MIRIPVNLSFAGALRLVASAYLRGQSVDAEDADRLAAECGLVCLEDKRQNTLHGLLVLAPLADSCTLQARVAAASTLRSIALDIERSA